MITFRSIGYLGRLGNQMFQFASAVGISRRRGYEVYFPIENCFRFIQNGPIDLKTGTQMDVKCDLLDCFDIPEGYFKNSSEIRPTGIYSEVDFKFNPQVDSIPPNTDLYGYFQDERYFKDFREEILRCFTFKEEHISESNKYWEEILSIIDGKSTVSLHVRRGDYTLSPDHHPVCSRDYYEKAMSNFSGDNFRFLIFSDDIEWCRDEFFGEKFIFVDSGSPYQDLRLMSECDHNIIANSSYSWWGAWLNQKKDKKVFAPSRWFGPAIQKDASEIYCEGWEKI